MAYSIHNMVIQILFRTTTNDKFNKVIIMVFISGFFIYTFICYGAFAIVNRKPIDSDP